MKNNSSELSRIRRQIALSSIDAFMRFYLKEYVSFDPSIAHKEIYSDLERAAVKRGLKLALAGPRNLGKTVIASQGAVLYSIVRQTEKFIIVLSDTESQACGFLETVRKELETNDPLLRDFPELRGKKPKPWTRTEFLTQNGIKLLGLGRLQNVRGRKFGKFRPTCVISDDVETRRNTESADAREKVKNWYLQDVLRAGDEKTNFLFLGTLVHPNCFLAELLDREKHPLWTKRLYKAIIRGPYREDLWTFWSRVYNSRENYCGVRGPEAAKQYYLANKEEMDRGIVLLWPQRHDYYALRTEFENDPVSFFSEIQNEPIDPRSCIFDVDECHFWDKTWKSLAELKSTHHGLEYFGACDLAVGDDASRGDYTAVAVIGRDRQDNTFYLVEVHATRDKIDQTIELILALHQKYKFTRFAVESNGFQVLGAQRLQQTGRQRGLQIPIVEVKHTGNKAVRIQRLQPLLKTGVIQIYQHSQLIEQLRYFPRGKYDDILDALEMAYEQAEKLPMLTVTVVGRDDDGWWRDYSRNLGWRF